MSAYLPVLPVLTCGLCLRCKGSKGGKAVKTNFSLDRYTDLLDCMDSITLEELIMAVRRQSQVGEGGAGGGLG